MDTNTVKLPEGFELETINEQPANLPEGFELETEPVFEPSYIENSEEVRQKAKTNLDTSIEFNVPLDVIDSGLFDIMSQMYNDPLSEGVQIIPEKSVESAERAEMIKSKILFENPVSRLVWKGLGAIGWPFQRMEKLIAG